MSNENNEQAQSVAAEDAITLTREDVLRQQVVALLAQHVLPALTARPDVALAAVVQDGNVLQVLLQTGEMVHISARLEGHAYAWEVEDLIRMHVQSLGHAMGQLPYSAQFGEVFECTNTGCTHIGFTKHGKVKGSIFTEPCRH